MPESKPHSNPVLVRADNWLKMMRGNAPGYALVRDLRLAFLDLEEQFESLLGPMRQIADLHRADTDQAPLIAQRTLLRLDALAASNTLDRKSEKTWGPERMRHDPL